MNAEAPPWFNGKPYYCKLCGAGGPERMSCEMPDCELESEETAKARQRREAKNAKRRKSLED